MTHIQHSPEYLKTKLHQKKGEFKNFENQSLEDLATIAKRIYYKQEINQPERTSYFNKDKLTKYMEVMSYLTNPMIHLELKTYDERILFLIMSVDPDLISFKEFLKTNITSTKKIEAEQDIKKKVELAFQREQEILDLQSRIREQIGFYDSRLIKYEEIYFKKFISERELITKVNQDNVTRLLAIAPFIVSFNPITDERYQVLQEKAMEWISMTNSHKDVFTAAYSCSNQKETIGLRNVLEELVFLILVADPELDALRIYEEESKMDEVERRCREEFNYYNTNLLTLEKIYHERFCPQKELSPWTHL